MAEPTVTQIEKRLKKVYKDAKQEVDNEFNAYLSKFAPELQEKQNQLDSGKITQAEYTEWLNRSSFKGKRLRELSQILAQHQTHANITAVQIVNDSLPMVFGYGYSTAIESIKDQATGMGAEIRDAWTLHDQDTINRLVTENRQLLPTRSVNIPKDIRWNMNHIQSALTAGLLHGDSIEHLADRLQRVTDMNRNAAIRNARTMVTGAENAGRQTSYDRMTKRGVKMKKVWMSTPDARTRDAHIVMDGQEVEEDEFFTDGEGNKLMYPGDPNGDPGSVYNCRCTMHAKVIGFDFGKSQEAEKEEPKPTAPQEEAQEELNLEKLRGTMSPEEFEEFKGLTENADNRHLWAKYGDKVASVKRDQSGGYYKPSANTLNYSYRSREGMSRYSTLAHEYNHAFDNLAGRPANLSFAEVDKINERCKIGSGITTPITPLPSNSDAFLSAMRTDMEAMKARGLRAVYDELKATTESYNATSGIQDALDGFYNTQHYFSGWGHGARYYNRDYNHRIKNFNNERNLVNAYKELGMPITSQAAAKEAFRQYEAASEAWANVGSAVTCGGPELEAMERYMPNTLAAYKQIAGGL